MFSCVTKYVVAVSLAAVACFSGFADVPCTKSEPYQKDGKWYIRITCSGTVQTETEVELEGDGGSCTNCTKMTPQECEEYKAHLISESDSILESARGINQYSTVLSSEIQQAISVLNMIQTEGDTFNYFAKASDVTGSSTASLSYARNFENFQQQPTGPYQFYSTAGTQTGSYQVWGGNNSIYNYYNEGVKPLLDNATPHLMNANTLSQQIEFESSYLISEVGAVRDYVSAIPCIACSGGSGGGGGDSGGGGSSGGCPCEELLNSIIALLEEKRDILKDWNDNQLPKLKQRLDYWQSMLKVIQDAVAPIGTNFLYAVQYKDLDGVTFQMKQLDKLLHNQPNKPNEFDFTAFKNYSWYTRVEYLLMSIAGVYSVTNRDDDLTQAGINEAYSDIADKSSTLETKVQSIKSNVTGLHTAFKSLFNALKSSVSTHDGSGTVTLSASWFDGRGLTFTLPSGVTGSLRTITSLLWTIIFVVVMDQFLLYAWTSFSYVYRFCVRQMTDFVK